MTDESAFVQAILARPGDASLRLIYADWLEERGDPRAELLRLDLRLRDVPWDHPLRDELARRFEELRASASMVWQALLLDHGIEPRKRRDDLPPPILGGAVCPNPICHWFNPRGQRHCLQCTYPMALPAGEIVAGRYRPEGEAVLGSYEYVPLALGSFGYIYRAQDEQTGRSVVLKELTAADPGDYALLLGLFREQALMLEALQSLPVVPRLVEFIEGERLAYLVVEDLGRLSLDDPELQPLPFEQVAEAGKQLCDLFDYMHRQEPLRLCPLKLDRAYSAGGRVRTVLPGPHLPGIGRLRERLRGEGYVVRCGLPAVEDSPERVIGYAEPRSDLFALAGVLYRLLTGQWLEGHLTSMSLFHDLTADTSPIPFERRWLYELIAVNLSESARDRYYSAREIRADLERQALTRNVTCPGCGRGNPVRQPFCAGCSGPLTDWAFHPCRACGGRYRMGSRSCPRCGRQVNG